MVLMILQLRIGLDTVPNSYFITERRLRSLRKAKKDDMVSFEDDFIKDSKFGTVGCVAIDKMEIYHRELQQEVQQIKNGVE